MLTLCFVSPASKSDDRRYIFEVKTKDKTLVVQPESQLELNDWLSAFQLAKQKALEQPSTDGSAASLSKDLAFAISPPSAPEFAAITTEVGIAQTGDESMSNMGVDRSSTLPIPATDLAARNSFDVNSSRRPPGIDGSGEGSRDSASRIMSRLDLHKRSMGGLGSGSGGGIASLIAASHGSMPVGPGSLPVPPTPDTPNTRKVSTPLALLREMPVNSLAPSTLASPPAPTNLSSTAVIVNGERGVGLSRPDSSGGVPSGLLANVWGSNNWGFLNRLERGEVAECHDSASSYKHAPSQDIQAAGKMAQNQELTDADVTNATNASAHRKTVSLDGGDVIGASPMKTTVLDYPNYYPTQLKMQDAQFRLLFPNVPRDEKLVLVFKATWNPNDQQGFPGRIYVTPKEIYFYSNHCGMTMTTSIHLKSISEVTAATGRDYDVVFLHLKETIQMSSFTRINIKTFLEPLKLLQRRLSYLASTAASASVLDTEEIMKALIGMERDNSKDSPSDNSWENVSVDTPVDGSSTVKLHSHRDYHDLRANVLIDQGLYGAVSGPEKVIGSKSFKLPKQPVIFVPSNMDRLVIEKEFNVSPKALFHVMFGDKSAVWQLLYHERQAQRKPHF